MSAGTPAYQIRHQCLKFYLHPNFIGAIEIARVQEQGTIASTAPSDRSTEIVEVTSVRERVLELINLPLDRVVPMPHLPPAVMGVYNWRGKMLWIVDIAKLLGFKSAPAPHLHRHFQPTIAISTTTDLSNEPKTIGFAVDEITEIEWCTGDLSAAPTINRSSPELATWIGGYARSVTGETLAILDIPKLFDRADLHADL